MVFTFFLVFFITFSFLANEPAERPGDATKPPQIDHPEFESDKPATMEAEPFKVEVNPGQEPNNHEYMTKFPVTPIFPKAAMNSCQEGMTLLKFTVTVEGDVKDIVVVEENPKGFGFAAASLATAGKIKYEPRVIDGVPQEVKDVQYMFKYEIANPCK